MTDILMPKLSDQMEEGTILTWLKASGERVAVGEELVEIETDKATIAYAAEEAGVLEILAAEGTTVVVGQPIARLAVTAPSEDDPSTAAANSVAIEISVAEPARPTATARSAQATVPRNGDARRSPATPLARRIAAVHGLALAKIDGTGPLGRITRADVLREAGLDPALPARRPSAGPKTPATPAPIADSARATPASRNARREPTRLQQLIARRMAEAKATIPHFQVQTEVVMDAAVGLRTELKQLAREGDPVPSFNDIIIKATAVALREHPLANASYKDGGFELHEAINIGVAVAADAALVVPTVFDAAGKSLGQIARETRALAARVRSGKITPPELSGGTFTVSNLGMFGMTAITPVINPPQAAILGVGAMRETLTRVAGEILDRRQLTLTLSCDHRILYGADAARFLARIRELLEAPLKLAF